MGNKTIKLVKSVQWNLEHRNDKSSVQTSYFRTFNWKSTFAFEYRHSLSVFVNTDKRQHFWHQWTNYSTEKYLSLYFSQVLLYLKRLFWRNNLFICTLVETRLQRVEENLSKKFLDSFDPWFELGGRRLLKIIVLSTKQGYILLWKGFSVGSRAECTDERQKFPSSDGRSSIPQDSTSKTGGIDETPDNVNGNTSGSGRSVNY